MILFYMLQLHKIVYIGNIPCGNLFKCSNLESCGAGAGLLDCILLDWMKKYIICSRNVEDSS